MMKKNIVFLLLVSFSGIVDAQIRTVNSATNVSVTNSPAFIDASSNTTVNGSSNVGKGLIFPRVDLSAMTAFPSVTAGIPNSFPTRFDGMIVYNTATSGTAGIGATSGTLTAGFWYYDNKSSTNAGGTWKPVTNATAAAGDNLGNHSATQNLALNSYELRLKGASDNNQSLVYNATVNGPRLFGASGGYLGTSNGTNALTWDSNGILTGNSDIYAGLNKSFIIKGSGKLQWDAYGGGWYMNDNNYIRSYNGKTIYTAGDVMADQSVWAGNNQWFLARGNGGIQFKDFGGGWYMIDTDWIRSYQNKNIYTGGVGRFDTRIETARVQGTSDRRFKKDITPIYNATGKLNQLNGYTYTWKDKKEFPGQALGEGKDMGVVAQEVEKVFPDAVMTNKDGYKSVNYNALIPVLIEALKESNKKIQALEDRLNGASAPAETFARPDRKADGITASATPMKIN